jgi:2-amino-4-hydroxy-6-hydroxymethyldihydropteridine diphosphokinase
MAGRRFVLAPLDEIAPRWKHPVTGLTARQMLANLPSKPGVRKLGRRG